MRPNESILLTGGTGYVGGRLIPLLERRGCRVRCLARNPAFLRARVDPKIEVVPGDLLNESTIRPAVEGVHFAFYLVHSMGTGADFEDEDKQAARNFAAACRSAGVKRIIYLGGLGNDAHDLSKHLRSRHEVGEILRTSGAQVVEFRASIIIGSGSLSFELIRSLVQKLPVMVWPRWVSTPAQPIAIEDVLSYLIAALDLPDGPSGIYEIGGPDQVSYGGVMLEYAQQRGVRRWTLPVPFLSPRLSSLWLGLVTPVYARVGRKLVESLRNPTVVQNDDARTAFPSIRPRGLKEAIARALANEDRQFAVTRWSDAISSSGPPLHWGGERFGNRLVDSRSVDVPCSVEVAFEPIRRIGGETGWYFANWLWRTRGFIDILHGGVGMRRGRNDAASVRVGDALDFWRVEAYEPNQRILLAAEMKVPGRAWLEFEVTRGPAGSTIRQTAIFDPVGLTGLAYWYAIYPLHQFVFAGMLRGIARAAISRSKLSEQIPHAIADRRELGSMP